jgi:uncharacterized membrane protein
MILMALDHVRDFFHRAAMSFSATDLTRTTTIIFLTRWITHFCMPVFMFTAGVSAFLWWHQNRRSRSELARFLLTRGIWFIFLELTVMQLSYNFNFSRQNMILLLVLWIFGLCMILLSALIWLPLRVLAALSAAVIVLHNGLDRFSLPVWLFLHQPGVFQLAGRTVLVSYPVLPWVAVMGAGFCFGPALLFDPPRRRGLMLRAGIGLTIAFFIMRTLNWYGDPSPHGAGVLSFLNCTKYPASLDYLLMTLGPALIALSLLDRLSFHARNPLIVFGRVPFLYYVAHLFVIHAVLVLLCWARYGNPAFGFMFHPVPSFGGPQNLFPSDFGYRLRVVYLVWMTVVALLYPLCLWFSEYKASHKQWWLRYL